jgi:flagellin
MGFRINTNISAMNAHTNAQLTNRNLDSSLSKISSGYRINGAADDASGMVIADSLRAQSRGLGQAISNANDAIGIVQIADKAMDEQIKILETIKTKAIQSAQDGQSSKSREALQKDVVRLMEELDNIANTTSYNGQNLLSGNFTNKKFQIGAYSDTTINASIGATSSQKIGHVRYETTANVTAIGTTQLTFSTGTKDIAIESVAIDYSANSGLGALAEAINKNSDETGVRASYVVRTTGSTTIKAGDIEGLNINGVNIGDIKGIKDSDKDNRLINAINAQKLNTGIEATIDKGVLVLNSTDGRGINVTATGTASAVFGGNVEGANMGRLTLSRLDARDIVVSTTGLAIGLTSVATSMNLTLSDTRANITSAQAIAIGQSANASEDTNTKGGIGAGITSLKGAMAIMDIAESAQILLDGIRADLGSVQNQLVATVNNISVTQVNVSDAESNIRDVDFASETANFSKSQILAQSGSYAMTQANTIQQNVMKLLQ